MPENSGPVVARRGVLLGAGAGAVALGAGMLNAGNASAAADTNRPSVTDGTDHTHSAHNTHKGFPIHSTLASAPLSEYTYRHVAMFDFTCEVATANRQYGGLGVNPTGAASSMLASVEVPAGTLVRDIEWYVYNHSGSPINALARVWLAGFANLSTVVKDISIPASGSNNVLAFRTTVPAGSDGPFPPGTKLYLILENMPVGTNVQINGARVGFNRGGGSTGLLRSVVRGYDSRSHSPLAAGVARTVTLPSGAIFPGTTGIVATITVFDPSATGFVKVWDPDGVEPAGAVLRYQAHQTAATTIDVPVSQAGKIRLLSSAHTDISVDITGLIA
jgi:hypothetical protein